MQNIEKYSLLNFLQWYKCTKFLLFLIQLELN